MKAVDIVKKWEGCKLIAYQDTAGIWTIGYGHTPALRGQQVSQAAAEALLEKDIAWAEAAVSGATVHMPTTPNQHAAMVSLTFNIGAGAFRTSSVLRYHRVGQYGVAATAFLLWDKEHRDGQLVVNQGLLNRRRDEAAVYSSGV